MLLNCSGFSVLAEPDERDITVAYDVISQYTVTIPQTVTLTQDGVTQEISANDVMLAPKEILSIKVISDFELEEESDSATKLGYTITKGTTILNNNDEIAKFYTSTEEQSVSFDIIPDTAIYAGDYSDTVTFCVEIESCIRFNIGNTAYYGEPGMSWSEWVESDFNTDGFTASSYLLDSTGKIIANIQDYNTVDDLAMMNDIIIDDHKYYISTWSN